MEQLLCSRKSKKTDEERNQKQDEKNSSRKIKSHESHHTHNESILKYSICHSTDHVATDGPFGIKLIQYFVFPKFSKMNPAERLELKKKGFCFQ